MKKNFIAEAIADPTKSFFFFLVFGIFGLSIASDALSDLVFGNLGTWLEATLGISELGFKIGIFAIIILLILLSIALTDLSTWLLQRFDPATVKPKPLKATCQGLITIMSRTRPGGKSAPEVAIEHHWMEGKGNLEHCWLICGGAESLQDARKLMQKITGEEQFLNPQKLEFEFCDPDDPNRKLKVSFKVLREEAIHDPNATFKLVNEIYTQASQEQLESEQIIADYTGGTKSMTAGLILACASPQRRLQFMLPKSYTMGGQADTAQPSVATEVNVAFRIKGVRS